MCKVECMRNCILAIALVGCALGCGDNSKACGPGTIDQDGTCVPGATCGPGTKVDTDTGQCVPDPSACAQGTVFDPLTMTCKIDPASCGNGTVLINNECVDPAVGLVIDVQEGPEPNGLGIVEASGAQAGNIMIKPIGSAYVLHGTLAPWRDADGDGALDPDVDTYVVQVTRPMVLEVTADGLSGVLAGFVAVAAVPASDALATWRRFGIHVAGDTSRRQLFLPRAGTYRIAIGDTRTLGEYAASGLATAVATGEYYVSINDLGTPTPTPITPTGTVTTLSSTVGADLLAFYTLPMGSGLNTVTVTMPSELAGGAVAVTNNDSFRGVADEPDRVIAGNIGSTDAPLIVIDHSINVASPTMDFTLVVTQSSAIPLATSGTVNAPSIATTDIAKMALFSIDAPTADSSLALQLSWSPNVIGQLYDGSGRVAATFTTGTATWSSYRGIVRLAEAGRYYFAVRSGTNQNTITATSTILALSPPAITFGTPLVATPNSVHVDAFAYTLASDPWQQFDVRGANTGGQAVAWFDPELAFGRLDTVSTSGGTLAPDVAPLFAHTYATSGGPIGRVVLDDPTTYYIKVTAVNPTSGPSVTLDFQRRAASQDLGSIAATLTRTGETIDPTTPVRYYVFRAAVGSNVTITVTPTSSVNTQFRRLNADETALGALVDTETFTQTGAWTAFAVSASAGLSAARTYDVSIAVQ